MPALEMKLGLCFGPVSQPRNFSKLDRSQASEQKYKRLLLNWAPLSAWVGAVASDDDAIEDAADDDDAMRKAKTLARLRKAF